MICTDRLKTQETTVKAFWTVNNKVCEPRPILRNLQPPSVFTEARMGERAWRGGCVYTCLCVCVCEWERAKKNEICWSHYDINVFRKCIILSGCLEFGSEDKQGHWESDKWGIPADCSTEAEGGMNQHMWHHGRSAWCRKRRTTSRPAVCKQSQRTLLGGFMTHWQVFPRTQLPEGTHSACVCF